MASVPLNTWHNYQLELSQCLKKYFSPISFITSLVWRIMIINSSLRSCPCFFKTANEDALRSDVRPVFMLSGEWRNCCYKKQSSQLAETIMLKWI